MERSVFHQRGEGKGYFSQGEIAVARIKEFLMAAFLVIDDHPIVRKGICQILEEIPGNVQISEASNASEALKIIRTQKFDVVLLDINLPGRTGLDLLEDFRRMDPTLKILVVSMYPEEQYAIRALRTGASGYLTKASAPDELLSAVDKILHGGRYITQSIAEKIFDAIDHKGPPHELLSNRELEVLIQIAKGLSLKDIGELLSLSEKTISTYRSRILAKMELNSNADIVRYALKHNLID
jgi:two-component system, NarL family, invasion response regulator UvrY